MGGRVQRLTQNLDAKNISQSKSLTFYVQGKENVGSQPQKDSTRQIVSVESLFRDTLVHMCILSRAHTCAASVMTHNQLLNTQIMGGASARL